MFGFAKYGIALFRYHFGGIKSASKIATSLFANYGIDYTGIEFSGVTFQEKIYPSYKWSRLVLYPFMSLGFTLLASLYPAFKLWKMLPVEALRKRKF